MRTMTVALACALTLCLLIVAPVGAQNGGSGPEAGATPTSGADSATKPPPTVTGTASVQELVDFRKYLMVGFSLVFALLIGFLVVTHRRGGQLAEEAEFLRKRLNEIQKNQGA